MIEWGAPHDRDGDAHRSNRKAEDDLNYTGGSLLLLWSTFGTVHNKLHCAKVTIRVKPMWVLGPF